MKREDLFEAIGAVDNEYLEHSERTQKRGHRILYRVGLVAATVALLCGTAMAFPAVREAVFGVKAERYPNFCEGIFLDDAGSSAEFNLYYPKVTPAENAPTSIETVYHLTYMPEGYSESGQILAHETDDGNEDYTSANFTYLKTSQVSDQNDLSAEFIEKLTEETGAPIITFSQMPATDCVKYGGALSVPFVGKPEIRNVTFGEVECQIVRGQIHHGPKDAKIVFWSDGDYLFSLLTDGLSDAELERCVTSLAPVEDCSPYLIFANDDYVDDYSVERERIETYYVPTALLDDLDKYEVYAEGGNGEICLTYTNYSKDIPYEECWWITIEQFTYKSADIRRGCKNVTQTRTINSHEVFYTDSKIVQEKAAIWQADGYWFMVGYSGNVTDDRIAEVIASLQPNEELTEAMRVSDTYSPSKVPEEWGNPAAFVSDNALRIEYDCDGLKGDGRFCFTQVPKCLCGIKGSDCRIEGDFVEEVRTVGDYEVTFRKAVNSADSYYKVYASWQWDKYNFTVSFGSSESDYSDSIDEIAEIIASVQPNENLKEVNFDIEQYYLPELKDGWEKVTAEASTVYDNREIIVEWVNEDCGGVRYSQCVTSLCIIDEEFVEKYMAEERVIGENNVIFCVTQNVISAYWEQGDYTMKLICADGDTTKWTVDDVAALVESVRPVEDITPYFISK